METAIITTTTYTDVITKFENLKKIYYTSRGCMISTVNDDFSKKILGKYSNLAWSEKYNKYAEADVLTAEINVIIFGKPFVVYLHRPIKMVHRYEYEEFFGFGGHCEGFSYDRIIMTFEERFNDNVDIEYMLMTGTLASGEGGECCVIDEKYIKNAFKLLVVGGYVKRWTAFNEFKEWFKERGFNVDFDMNNGETFTSFIFEDYAVVEKPVQDCNS